MAAMLDKNHPNGTPVAYPGLPTTEIVSCREKLCETTYTLAYGQTENRIEADQNVLDLIRRTALEKVTTSHPHNPLGNDTYVWGGTKLRWLDKEQATAAGQ